MYFLIYDETRNSSAIYKPNGTYICTVLGKEEAKSLLKYLNERS